MKCCDNCKFFVDEEHAEETYCNWWDTAISLPTDECCCARWVYVNDDDGLPTGRVCNKCGHEVVYEKTNEVNYPYYCPECDENRFKFETNAKR